MAKKIKTIVKLAIQAGTANPAPPVGTALGPHGIKIMDFCQEFNEKTKEMRGSVIPAVITIYEDRSFDFIIKKLTRHVNSKRGAELSIAALVSIANLCTANNTIAIITTGPIAKDIAKRFHLDRRKTASILDTFSCLIQGIIPYGAQMLIAAGLANISPISIIGNLYYPFTMGICALLAILFRYPRRYS